MPRGALAAPAWPPEQHPSPPPAARASAAGPRPPAPNGTPRPPGVVPPTSVGDPRAVRPAPRAPSAAAGVVATRVKRLGGRGAGEGATTGPVFAARLAVPRPPA